MKFQKNCVILIKLLKNNTKNLGVAQMVARYLGVVEAAGSNPVTQTKKCGLTSVGLHFLFCVVGLKQCHDTTPAPKVRGVGEGVLKASDARFGVPGCGRWFKSSHSDQKSGVVRFPIFLYLSRKSS